MNYKDLMKQPNGILFYESDINAPGILQKIETVKDDIIVRAFDYEFEESRLGLREMDSTDKNSKSYQVFDLDGIVKIQEFLHEAVEAVGGYEPAGWDDTIDVPVN
jgi:hypothetical protein